nr:hypothetical protein [Tanacetum cinerariifolium]
MNGYVVKGLNFRRYLGLGSLETKEAADCSTAALEVVEGAPDVDDGAQSVLTPVQSTQPPPAATPTRTITQRMTILEEEVHGMRVALDEQIERRGRMFNWQMVTYGKSYCDDLDFFTYFEADYPAII